MTTRVGIAIGWLITAAAGAWWFGAVALAQRGADEVAPLADSLLAALWMVRALALFTLGVGAAIDAPWGAASRALLGIVIVAWPLVILGLAASEVPFAVACGTEAGLLGLALGLPALGRALRRLAPPTPALRAAASAGGVVLASALWWQRSACLGWFGR